MALPPTLGVDVTKVATTLTEAGVPGFGFSVGQRYLDEDGNEYVLCSTATDIDASAGVEPVSISADNFVVAASGNGGEVFGWLTGGQDTEDTVVKYVWVQVRGKVQAGTGSADSTAIQTVGAWVHRTLDGSGDLQAEGTTNDFYAIVVDDTAGAEYIFIP